jgi:hypothetical protein
VTCAAPTQAPAWHLSVVVQALLSLQVVLFGFSGLLHCPVLASQLPAEWH